MSDQPWQVVETTVYQLDGKPLRGAPFGVNAWWAHVQGPDKDLCLKVAAKMGAAAELYYACWLISFLCEANGEPVDGFRFREAVAMARAAVKKAGGEPPSAT